MKVAHKSIDECEDVYDKFVFLRSSLNVPLDDEGVVTNEYRLLQALPTITHLKERGAKVIIFAHIGRSESETLKPVYEQLKHHVEITWGGEYAPELFHKAKADLQPGSVLMMENLRQHQGETSNDPDFADALASTADIYVCDAFANMHRDHASMTGVAKRLPAYLGLHARNEITALSQAMHPISPSLFILGGAKFETKITLVEKYLEVYDQVFIGGALVHDILKARGLEVGKSLVSDISLADAQFLNHEKLLVPVDVVVKTSDSDSVVKMVDEVDKDDIIMDCGPKTIALLAEEMKTTEFVLWNGPLGNYENGYPDGTEALAEVIANSHAKSYVGGGDTVAAIQHINRDTDFTFISTGGGAMLTFLEQGDLPVLQYLRK